MTSASDRYFLPKNYEANPIVSTRETVGDKLYWTKIRFRNALYYQLPVYRFCSRYIARHCLRRVIDVGCGVGRKLQLLHDRHPCVEITGIDQPHPISFCRESYDFGRWLVDDFDSPNPELEGVSGQLVICADVIEHLEEPDNLLKYLTTCCEPEGLIVISTPDRAKLPGAENRTPMNPDHVREWTGNEFLLYLKDRGFEVLKHFHVPPLPMSLNTAFIREALKTIRCGGSFRNNQVCLVRPGRELVG